MLGVADATTGDGGLDGLQAGPVVTVQVLGGLVDVPILDIVFRQKTDADVKK